ncbi:hypothetical protein HMPREF0724_14955 [Prescottella equi ATCC 33707]|uniref:Uncharacterized protein n=1 Tax=Prescottella equi ATCC 33707 TaxID=525370 RepID=E9T849_RHOHA|nr:hypothetical protein HMPREF0724_14955 [Prescottella equi ATCC 33707]
MSTSSTHCHSPCSETCFSPERPKFRATLPARSRRPRTSPRSTPAYGGCNGIPSRTPAAARRHRTAKFRRATVAVTGAGTAAPARTRGSTTTPEGFHSAPRIRSSTPTKLFQRQTDVRVTVLLGMYLRAI